MRKRTRSRESLIFRERVEILSGGLLISGFFAAPLAFTIWGLASGRQLYDGSDMFLVSIFTAVAVALISWLPHIILIGDGKLPQFTHEKNTPFLFWYLVITLGLCATILAIGPILPLADGYSFSDTGLIVSGRAGSSAPVALWIAAPPVWAVSALLFYFIGRGLWRHYQPAAKKSGDPVLRLLEALIPPLRGQLILTKKQREERARNAQKKRDEREQRPEGSLNLPLFITMPLWLSTFIVALTLPPIVLYALMPDIPPNAGLPLAGLVFLAFFFGWLALFVRLREPESWLLTAGLGGLFLLAALILSRPNTVPPLILLVVTLHGVGYLSVGLFKWFRTKPPGRA